MSDWRAFPQQQPYPDDAVIAIRWTIAKRRGTSRGQFFMRGGAWFRRMPGEDHPRPVLGTVTHWRAA